MTFDLLDEAERPIAPLEVPVGDEDELASFDVVAKVLPFVLAVDLAQQFVDPLLLELLYKTLDLIVSFDQVAGLVDVRDHVASEATTEEVIGRDDSPLLVVGGDGAGNRSRVDDVGCPSHGGPELLGVQGGVLESLPQLVFGKLDRSFG